MRAIDISAALLAAVGVTLAIEAWLAGSLFRYQLAGLVAGTALCLPGLSILLLRERARRAWQKVLFAVVPLVAVLLLAELVMRLVAPALEPPGQKIEDDRLGHILAPGTGGTDEWGFRNERVPAKVDVLFIGDSQTWGFYLEREQALAAQFAQLAKVTTYQMAHGGYGPVQHRELLRRGLSLQPRLVVVGFYFGNDIVDAATGAGLVGAEDLRAAGKDYVKPRHARLDGKYVPNWTLGFIDFMQDNSRLCGWAGEIVRSRLRSVSFLDAQAGAVRFEHDAVGTMLLPEYRRRALDLAQKRIADGMRITARCLTDIAAQSRAANTRCILLAIPTKEYCYAEWQRRAGKPLTALDALHAAETAVRERVFAAAKDAKLEVVDLAPRCIDALGEGTPIWATSGDGHLRGNGHLAATRAIVEIWSGK